MLRICKFHRNWDMEVKPLTDTAFDAEGFCGHRDLGKGERILAGDQQDSPKLYS